MDLRSDVDDALVMVEGKVGFPSLGKVTGGAAVSLAAVPVAKAIAGLNILQSCVRATKAFGVGTAMLTLTANRPGTPGNSIQYEAVQGAGALSVNIVGTKITVTLAAAGSTANDVKVALDANTAIAALVQVVSGGGGTVLVTPLASLEGGTGSGLEVKINGIEQSVVGAVTDSAIPMRVSDLTGSAAGDSVALQVKSNGVMTNAITLDVVA
jgi:hypothetical protein